MAENFFKVKYKDILYWILFISLFQGMISNYLGFSQVTYICDFLLIVLLVAKLSSNKRYLLINKRVEVIPIYCFILFVIIGWIFNPAPIAMAVWGVRNYGRFFLYFVLSISILNAEDADKMEDMFVRVFPIHISVIAFQYIVEGLNQDRLSGIFGKETGGNGGLMIYLAIMLCIIMARYR